MQPDLATRFDWRDLSNCQLKTLCIFMYYVEGTTHNNVNAITWTQFPIDALQPVSLFAYFAKRFCREFIWP